jgi:hypothetical protein
VSTKIAAALAGNNQTSRNRTKKAAAPEGLADLDGLIQSLSARLLVEGIDAARVRDIVTEVTAAREAGSPTARSLRQAPRHLSANSHLPKSMALSLRPKGPENTPAREDFNFDCI